MMKDWILFGFGNLERTLAIYLFEKYNDRVRFIVDSDKKKWGNVRYPIKSPDEIKKYVLNKNIYIVISTFHYIEEIKAYIKSLGIPDNRIIVAINEKDIVDMLEFELYMRKIDMSSPLPRILNLELSGYCNCKCVYCPFHGKANLKARNKGFLNLDTLEKIIETIKKLPSIETVDTTGPGEIFLNKDWFIILTKLLGETSINKVIIYTNGMLLKDDNIKQIAELPATHTDVVISLDGKSPEENDAYRIGSRYDIVKDNIKKAAKFFENKDISLKITNCYPTNRKYIESHDYIIDSKYNEIPTFLQKDFPGFKIASQKTFWYGKNMQIDGWDIVKVKWPDTKNICLNLFDRIAIDYAGNLLRCSCGVAGVKGIANVNKDDVIKVWKEDYIMNQARENFKLHRYEDDFCTGCPGKGLGEYSVLISD